MAVMMLILIGCATAHANDWPQWRGEQCDGIWRETGIIDKFSSSTLTPRWRAPVGPGYSGPTVAAERVYLMDRQSKPEQTERILCFDAATGKPLWQYAYPCVYSKVGYPLGPRASVIIANGRAWGLGTMGHLHCLDAATGKLLWKHDLGAEYKIRVPVWGISASPLLDGDRVIVNVGGADGAGIIAFDAQSGKERWRALDDGASYSTPVITRQNGRRVLVCWTADSVAGLDPATGKVYWRQPYKQMMAVASPVIDRGRVFVSSFYGGSMMLRLKENEMGVEVAWRRAGASEVKTDSMHSTIATPIVDGDYIYGLDSYGELRCLKAATGDRVWEDLTAVPRERWGTIHFVRHGAQTWMFNERGELLITRLSPRGLRILSRAKLIEPTPGGGVRKGVCWAHPAFAGRCIFARNDRELVCASLATDRQSGH
jgi:outer membrane protein assembly factor BamB